MKPKGKYKPNLVFNVNIGYNSNSCRTSLIWGAGGLENLVVYEPAGGLENLVVYEPETRE